MTEQTTPDIPTMPDASHVHLARLYVDVCRDIGQEADPLIEAIALHQPDRKSAPEKLAAVARVLRAVVAAGSIIDNVVTSDGHVAIEGDARVDPADAAVIREVLGIDT